MGPTWKNQAFGFYLVKLLGALGGGRLPLRTRYAFSGYQTAWCLGRRMPTPRDQVHFFRLPNYLMPWGKDAYIWGTSTPFQATKLLDALGGNHLSPGTKYAFSDFQTIQCIEGGMLTPKHLTYFLSYYARK